MITTSGNLKCSRYRNAAFTLCTAVCPVTTYLCTIIYFVTAMSASQNQVKSYGFGLKALKKFPEVLPLVSIMGVATVGVGAFCLYALFEKTDVKINRSELARWDTIDVNQPQKVRQASDRHCLLHLVYSFIHLWYRFAGMLRV
ncbi:uncharacterized protein LOC122246437 isoform X1 [Penaeus japonicus]|uniref:uncharacterized protein LOC122246437 isoform X1 n=1 Tax=Penaeus japonicus TaxID=27405 RepID=UPI001C710541|nr:uncharacterized protein LOC122246437 isoform X1 [Penaeus japonicus]